MNKSLNVGTLIPILFDKDCNISTTRRFIGKEGGGGGKFNPPFQPSNKNPFPIEKKVFQFLCSTCQQIY